MISLLSKGLSGVFSSTIVQRHQFFSTQLLYHPALTTIRDHQEDHSLNYALKHMTLGEHNPAPHSIPCFTALLRQLATQMSSVRTRRCVCTGVITSMRKDVSPAQQPTSVGFLHLSPCTQSQPRTRPYTHPSLQPSTAGRQTLETRAVKKENIILPSNPHIQSHNKQLHFAVSGKSLFCFN